MLPPLTRFGVRWPAAVVLLIVLLTLVVSGAGASPTLQTNCVNMFLDPLNSTPAPNSIITVAVKLNSPTQPFLGADFDLRFNPTVLQVVTAAGVPATTVEQGNLGGIAPVNLVENISPTVARVRYAEVRVGTEVTGLYTLATIRFKVIGAAGSSSALTFFDAKAAGVPNPNPVDLLCSPPANGLVTVPTPTPTPTLPPGTSTPTRTPTPTATNTAAPPPLCPNILQDSGFELNNIWQHPITPRRADYTTTEKFAGSRSMRHGILPGTGDVYAHSSAYQQVSIPSNATRAVLVFYYKPFSQEAEWTAKSDEDWDWYNPADVIEGRAGKDAATDSINAPAWGYTRDWQETLILDARYRTLATVFRGVSNAGQWRRVEYDLTRFKNQTINVYFNVLNNGTGDRRTWMFVDEAYIYICTGPQPPTPTPSPTLPPPAGCSERVLNGGFESDAVWQNPITPYKANYTTLVARTGARSMRLGVPPPATDVFSHSSAYQSVVIPADAQSARLTFWFKPHTEEPVQEKVGEDWTDYQPGRVIRGESMDARPGKTTAGDYQEALILDRYYNPLRTIFRTESNFGAWAQMTVDVTAYKGRRIVPYFNVFNDGDGRNTWMFVDDVSLEVCYPGGAAEASVAGQVTLQGRADWSDSVVGVDEMPCDQTGPTGSFECTVAQDEPNAAKLTADHAGYLRAEKPLGAVSSLGSSVETELVAGDVNDDCTINVFDLVIVAYNYDSDPLADVRGDINGDGRIDILDLVLVATNYGMACPTAWVAPTTKTSPADAKGSATVAMRGLSKGDAAKPPLSLEGRMVWAEVTVNATNLYGADIRLSFDPTRLAPLGDSGEVGKLLSGAHVVRNSVDAKTGTVRFVATLMNPAPAANGSGVVYRVPFRVLASEDAKRPPTVRLDSITLVQKGGVAIDMAE